MRDVTNEILLNDELSKLLKGELADAFNDVFSYETLSSAIRYAPHFDSINRVLFSETTTLLSGNNLAKPDRMAMARSVEVRSPFLDYRMEEFAFTVSGTLKLRHGETKWILKKAVQELLGLELTWRKNQMFTVPIGEWFRSTLVQYCRSCKLYETIARFDFS
jgi:asparagine synthase (glutamine-hydrolysing)